MFQLSRLSAAGLAAMALAGCGGDNDPAPPGPARLACADINTASLGLAGLRVTQVETVAAGAVTPTGAAQALPTHCRLQGQLDERTSTVDGKPYGIGFELRMPAQWNGRFLFQGGGGTDGSVQPAVGTLSGGGATTNALTMGFAVVSTDGGHTSESAPVVGGALFGLDPQARVDYGYNAVGRVTPVAKELLKRHYGQGPDRSYFAGCSNGGRQAMVAASRFADQFDGIVAGNPGFNLPKSAVQHAWDVQALASVAPLVDGKPVIAQAFTNEEMAYVSRKVLDACDRLDGATDGMVNAVRACQTAFQPASLQCGSTPEAGCLTAAKVGALQKIFAGPTDSGARPLYADWSWDAGVHTFGWRIWKMGTSATAQPNAIIATLGGGSLPYVFMTPPERPEGSAVFDYLLNFDFDTQAPGIFATSGLYGESSMSFMTPPQATRLQAFRDRGGKLLVYHGNSDPVFSLNDTVRWYEELNSTHGGNAASFARLFTVPGMNHCSGGPATDQFDALSAMVQWVEKGTAPDSLLATARPGNADAAAFAGRTRPLCAWPRVATYKGSGSIEDAASFSCELPS
ncbi:tannase/feruloyl esterase family alpha/beta hydrolase [Caldimonas tepidiphila]|uniref:tannase/feruloyl esterase family alpha/beta hydrolase n=1 Tax=Caldimonas tepidiphila TaxID=2315841 RepID=UPI000E5B3DA4|nr:tannase/feruloyl esterase family alpha/beta hydrolase [Caldimonas tepidiphila]